MASPIADLPFTSYADVVFRISADDPTGITDLDRLCSSGLQIYLRRHAGTAAEDLYHDVLADAIEAIRKRGLREPDALMSYVTTIAKRHVIAHVRSGVRSRHTEQLAEFVHDKRPNPESAAIERERIQIALDYLQQLRPRDREVLIRFYCRGEGKEQILHEMGLTETQFRVLKSRAKARFADRVQAVLGCRSS